MKKAPHRKKLPVRGLLHGIHCAAVKRSCCRVRMIIILMRKNLPQPPLRPAVLLAGRSSTDERAYPPRPQAMEGSPEGRVPLAPSAEDRPPRRRIKRQSPALTSIKKPPSVILYRQTYPIPFSAVNMAGASVQTFPSGGGVSGGTQSAL